MSISDGASSSPDATLGELVARMSEQTARLVRDEVRLAQVEMVEKGKKVGVGVGLFGAAGIMALFGVAVLIVAAILGLALVIAGWAAALIVAGVLLAAAGVVAVTGKKDISQAAPPVPTDAAEGIKADVAAVKEGIRS